MTQPVVPGQALALRVLLQANPRNKEDPHWWRVADVVRHAADVYGCAFQHNSARTLLTQTLVRKGFAQSKKGAKGVVLHSLTAEVRAVMSGLARQGLRLTRPTLHLCGAGASPR